MKLLLKGGRIVDPANNTDEIYDILIRAGKVERIGKKLGKEQREYDLSGKAVLPGLIDLHTHLREPGREDTETIASGTAAAAHGGFTTVCAMPNTNPPIDSVSGVKYVLTTSSQEGKIGVLPVGAITKNRKGKALTEIGKMSNAGIVAISDDGDGVMNSRVMRRAMEYSKMFGIILISHCEDHDLSKEGMINEGITSTKMGLKGIPSQAEVIMVARDIALAGLTGCRLHLAHITTSRSVDLIRDAKNRGVNVTAEVTPHHITLTEKDINAYNTNCKVNPPLRTEKDRRALISGLKDGTIDCISTDHAPHLDTEKEREFALSPFGMTGLETAFPLAMQELVRSNKLTLSKLVEKMSANPASILKKSGIGRIEKGLDANITVIDTELEKEINKEFFLSKSKNSPFKGKKLKGFPILTLYRGRIAFKDEKVFS